MPWMPGIPHDQGTCPQGSLRPAGAVAHRTYGAWPGDYQVGLGSRDPVGFHFLVGPDPGQVVQFYDTDVRCAHAGVNAGGNDCAVGVEVSGTNSDPLTPWQLEQCAAIVDWLHQVHGIEPTYRFSTAHDLTADRGWIPHSAVRGSDHSDFWTVDDWNRIVGDDMTDAQAQTLIAETVVTRELTEELVRQAEATRSVLEQLTTIVAAQTTGTSDAHAEQR